MASNQRLNAVIRIGGAIQASFRNAIGGTTGQLGQVGRAVRELTERQRRLAAAADHWQRQGRDASRFTDELRRVNRELERQQRIGRNLRAQQQNQGNRDQLRGQLFDAVALGATLAAPVKVAMDFEQAMARVGAVSQASSEDLGRLTRTARELGASTSWSASQAADGMQFLAMAGFSTEQTIAAMPGMLSLASAGAVELGDAADIASNILSGFNMQAGEMGRLGDVLTNTFTSSKTNLNGLGETMKYVAPIAAATGVSLEQAAAMAGKLGDAGIQGSDAGTALRSVISRLAAPTGNAAKLLDQLGVKTKDANGNLRDVPDVLADLNNSMTGFGSAARAEITSTIFGLEAASGATILLGKAGDGSLQSYAENLEKTGSAARVAEMQNATATGAMKRLGSAVESIAITLGNLLLPVVTDGANLLSQVIGVVDTLAQTFPLLTTVVVGGTAGLIALKVAATAGGFAFTFLRGAWLSASLVGLRLGALLPMMATGIRAVGIALAANPIGATIAGIALAAGLIYANWEPIKGFFVGLWDTVSGLFRDNWELIKTIFSWSPLGLVMRGWGAAFDWLSSKIGWLGDAVGKVKGIFGIGGDAQPAATTPAAASAIAATAPASAVAAGAAGNRTANINNTITIQQQPGQDARQLAEEIARVQREQERGALYDDGMAYGY